MALDKKIIDTLSQVTTATLTTLLLKKGLRNVWMRGTRPLNPGQPRLVGPAFTLRFVPAREDLATPESWSKPISTRAAIEAMPEGCITVVDAMVTGSPPGSILFWDAGAAPLSRETFRCSTHALGVAEAVELARALGKLPPQLGIFGIEGAGFEAGAPPSREVLRAVEKLAKRIAQEV